MARNGSGTYSLPVGYEATTGATATATQHNAPLEDLATDMNTARPVVAGGTGATNATDARVNLGVTARLNGTTEIAPDLTVTGWKVGGTAVTPTAATLNLLQVLEDNTGTPLYHTGAANVLPDGYATADYSADTKTTGTYTPAASDGSNTIYYINGGAHTLAPPANSGTVVIQVTNNASAGAITTSGFTAVRGDSLTTTDGDKFMLFIAVCNGESVLNVVALQ